ncbi:hypothetical protein [Morganella morganii]|uniref:hypothetical protein n=1 Tax=Morganella morganii TaxID=582 RepID=UPI00339BF8AE
MNNEDIEATLQNSLNKLSSILDAKIAEVEADDIQSRAQKKKNNKAEFFTLTEESQKAARVVLAELLKQKYQSGFDLPDDTANYLGHRVRKAFITLESDRKDPVICNSESIPGFIPD